MIARLPRYDESVEVLITQLVASKAQVFAGRCSARSPR